MAALSWLVALALGVSAPGSVGAHCRVKSRAGSIETVTVRPTGTQPFDVKLTKVPLSVAPPTQRGGVSSVHVAGPIEFSGEATRVGYLARWRVTTPGGLVRLVKGTVVDDLRAKGLGVIGDVVFEQSETYDKNHNAHLVDSVVAEDQPLSCAALNVDDGAQTNSSNFVRAKVQHYTPRVHELSFFQWPAKGRKVVVRINDPGSVFLNLLAERGSQLRLELRYHNGARVVGWVPRSLVQAVDAPGTLVGAGSGSGCGVARDFISRAGTYEGPVVVRPGARIFADRKGHDWAKVPAGKPLKVNVLHNRGEKYAFIEKIPGISEDCDLMDHALVDKDDVSFPKSAGPR